MKSVFLDPCLAFGVLIVIIQYQSDVHPYTSHLCCYSKRKGSRKWKSHITVHNRYLSLGMPMLPDLTLFLDVQWCSQVILNCLSYCMHVILNWCSSCIPENYYKSDPCKTRTISPCLVIKCVG